MRRIAHPSDPQFGRAVVDSLSAAPTAIAPHAVVISGDATQRMQP